MAEEGTQVAREQMEGLFREQLEEFLTFNTKRYLRRRPSRLRCFSGLWIVDPPSGERTKCDSLILLLRRDSSH